MEPVLRDMACELKRHCALGLISSLWHKVLAGGPLSDVRRQLNPDDLSVGNSGPVHSDTKVHRVCGSDDEAEGMRRVSATS